MYNRYISGNTPYERIPEEKPSNPSASRSQYSRNERQRPPPPSSPKGSNPLDGVAGRLGGLLKNFHFDDLDSGDILLILILIFLFLESDDNLELVITLGLLVAFGLFGKDSPKEDHPSATE